MKLTTTQKDILYDLIEESRLSPSQFNLEEKASIISKREIPTNLLLKGHNYFFSFETGPYGSHYAICCPGIDAYEQQMDTGSWQGQIAIANRWIY
jgi:hypothetical protein